MASYADGQYHGKLKSGTVGKTANGNPQMLVVFDVTHFWDLTRGDWAAVAPFERTVRIVLSANAWKYAEKKLKSLGFNGNFTTPDFADKAKLEGVELVARSEPGQDGKLYQEWELANWGGGMQTEPAPDDVLRSLAAKWKAGNAAPPPVPPVPTGTPAEPPAPPAAAAPAPAAEPQPQGELRDATTKAGCWAIYCDLHGDEPDLARWGELIAKRGKPEAEFTDEDWQKLAADIQIPF